MTDEEVAGLDDAARSCDAVAVAVKKHSDDLELRVEKEHAVSSTVHNQHVRLVCASICNNNNPRRDARLSWSSWLSNFSLVLCKCHV